MAGSGSAWSFSRPSTSESRVRSFESDTRKAISIRWWGYVKFRRWPKNNGKFTSASRSGAHSKIRSPLSHPFAVPWKFARSYCRMLGRSGLFRRRLLNPILGSRKYRKEGNMTNNMTTETNAIASIFTRSCRLHRRADCARGWNLGNTESHSLASRYLGTIRDSCEWVTMGNTDVAILRMCCHKSGRLSRRVRALPALDGRHTVRGVNLARRRWEGAAIVTTVCEYVCWGWGWGVYRHGWYLVRYNS